MEHENNQTSALAPLGERVAIPQSRESRVRGFQPAIFGSGGGTGISPADGEFLSLVSHYSILFCALGRAATSPPV